MEIKNIRKGNLCATLGLTVAAGIMTNVYLELDRDFRYMSRLDDRRTSQKELDEVLRVNGLDRGSGKELLIPFYGLFNNRYESVERLDKN